MKSTFFILILKFKYYHLCRSVLFTLKVHLKDMKLASFLKQIRSPSFSSKLYCVGNSSADMDSVVSAIAYSFWAFHQHGKQIIPLINIPRDDLPLRRDIVHLLKSIDVDLSHLVFIEDVKERDDYQFILVDHNVPRGELKDQIARSVIGIVDHHKDEFQFESVDPRRVEICGSCSSLVHMIFKQTIEKLDLDLSEKKFMLAPLALDTNGLTQRVELKDRQSFDLFKLDQHSFDDFTKEMKLAKDNIEGMSCYDLLRKDYKQWTTDERKELGVSSSTANLMYLSSLDGFEDDVSRWAQLNRLKELVIMSSFEQDGEFQRQIGFQESTAFDLGELTEELNLVHLKDIKGFKIYQQRNIKASRKQVAPLLLSLSSL